ncbi:MAG: hypothetical protein Q9187_001202 [Circinaria calcarea]
MIRCIAPFRIGLFSMISATEVSTIAIMVGLETTHEEMRRFLNPVRDLEPYTNEIMDRIDSGDMVLLMGKDTFDLISRIRDPIGYWNKMRGKELLVIMVLVARKNKFIDTDPLYVRMGIETNDKDMYSFVPYTMCPCAPGYTCDHFFQRVFSSDRRVMILTEFMTTYIDPAPPRINPKTIVDGNVHINETRFPARFMDMYLPLPMSSNEVWTAFINSTTSPFVATRTNSIHNMNKKSRSFELPNMLRIQFNTGTRFAMFCDIIR